MRITKHRQKILDALREWFRIHKEGPTLDPLIAASFPQIIKTVRDGWQKVGVPWLFATETTDLSNLGDSIKDWLREEFSCLEDVELILARLNDKDWHWEEPKTYSLLDPQNKDEIDILYPFVTS